MMMPLSTADEIMKRKPRLAAIEVSFIANNVRPGERWDPELRDPQKKVRLLYTRVTRPPYDPLRPMLPILSPPLRVLLRAWLACAQRVHGCCIPPH